MWIYIAGVVAHRLRRLRGGRLESRSNRLVDCVSHGVCADNASKLAPRWAQTGLQFRRAGHEKEKADAKENGDDPAGYQPDG